MSLATMLQMSPRRLVFGVFVLIIILHFLFTLAFKNRASLTTLADLGGHLGLSKLYDNATDSTNTPSLAEKLVVPSDILPSTNLTSESVSDLKTPSERTNATFVFLCRNSDINGVVASVQQMEDRFNKKYGYPWVFLNEEPFTDEFKRRVSVLTDSPIHFGQIPAEHWYQPKWINETKATEGRLRMMEQGIIYADSVPYRNMCRFNSGHELLKPYRYYWRVEPSVKFFCDLDYDPFHFMNTNNKTYGFTISLVEWEATIPTLWATVKEFITAHPEYVSPDNAMGYLSDDQGQSYNLCHFWSNFEIADMDFWRGEAYQKFFDYLESKGGFYYERWGDAPVHSIAAALLARKEQLHFFRDIGYKHEYFQHCPTGADWEKGRCSCDSSDTFDYAFNSCIPKYDALF